MNDSGQKVRAKWKDPLVYCEEAGFGLSRNTNKKGNAVNGPELSWYSLCLLNL